MDSKLRIDFGPTLNKLSESLTSAYDDEPKLVKFMLGDDEEEESKKTKILCRIQLMETTESPNLWKIRFSILQNFGQIPDEIEDRSNILAEYSTKRMRGKIVV